MPRRRPGWKDLQADLERRTSARDTAWRRILEDAHPLVYHTFVEWNREPQHYWPGISADTGPVTIYGPEGTVREVLTAEEFRRRFPPRLRTVRR